MKIKNLSLLIGVFCFLYTTEISADTTAPTVEILGKEYYYHEVKKGESVYGIAKKYGWDLSELLRLNPNAGSDMQKGERLYYPTGKVTKIKEEPKRKELQVEFEPIKHTVKKGETVYSISRQYGIPLDYIYASNPDSKYGIKAGETLIIEQTPETASSFFYYEIKRGDTLYSLANKFNTSIEDILKYNPGVSEANFRTGEILRIKVNSNNLRIEKELVEEERLASLDSYKAKKNDTWESISEETGVDVNTLIESNGGGEEIEKDQIITVPVVETVKVEKEVPFDEIADNQGKNIQEIYDSIHGVDNISQTLTELRIAILLDDPSSKKDIEFTRGFLMGLENLKNTDIPISLSIIDGRIATNSLERKLDESEPQLIIATADKNFPAFLADYGNTNNAEVINVFDVRNSLYEDNASMIQILPSSEYFNELTANYLEKKYGSYKLLVIGEGIENDGLGEILKDKYDADNINYLKMTELSEFQPENDAEYLIYVNETKKEFISDYFQIISSLKENYPMITYVTLGKPNWLVNIDEFSYDFREASVIIPSRVWLDEDSHLWKNFSEKYEEEFGASPVRSYPNFAASGYDIATYFIPLSIANGGDYNRKVRVEDESLLQSEIIMQRINNWGGFLNQTSYMIEFGSNIPVRKILLK